MLPKILFIKIKYILISSDNALFFYLNTTMTKDQLKINRLLYLSILFFLLLNFPILTAYNKNLLLGGSFPMLFVFIFGLWLLLIGLMAWVANKS